MPATAMNFQFSEITDEMIAALPEKDRALWLQLRAQRAEQAAHVARLVEQRHFAEALVYHDSKERAEALVSWEEQYALTDAEALTLLTEFWSISEAWSGDERLRDGMMRLLRRVAPLFVYGEGEVERISALSPEPLTIYRGNLGETPGTGSWSLDVETAERFAAMAMSPRGMFLGMYREDGVPSVWRAEVNPADILGYFNVRDEREVVVDGAHVRDVTLIRQARTA